MNQISRLIETSRNYLSPPNERQLEVRLAGNPEEIRLAQKLRQEVFSSELCASSLNHQTLDEDEFDEHCQHLIVIDHAKGQIVGTYRVLSAASARRIGRFYSEQEFDLTPLSALRDSLVELGRSCVHPDYRDGAVIRLLWSGLGEILQQSSARYVIGCPSVSIADGGHYAAALFRTLSRKYLCDPALRVKPRNRLPYESLYADCDPVVPPLIKGYIRVGAKMMGEPHRDLAFGTVDFLMMLPVASIADRYSRKFMGTRPLIPAQMESLPA